jgi:cytolysin-activating lysine-acyltransferase
VIANFAQVVKTGKLRLHPQIGGLVEKELLEKMGTGKSKGPAA